MQPHGVRLKPKERAELARQAFALWSAGEDRWEISAQLDVSEPTVRNLINYGRRLAIGVGQSTEQDK